MQSWILDHDAQGKVVMLTRNKLAGLKQTAKTRWQIRRTTGLGNMSVESMDLSEEEMVALVTFVTAAWNADTTNEVTP